MSILDLNFHQNLEKKQERQVFSLVVKILAIESMVPPRFHVSVDRNIAETTVSLFLFTHKPKD